MNVDDDEEVDDLHDHFYDQIIRRRNITRRTNWRHRANALSQREVALAAGIQLSANDCVTMIFMILFFARQLMMMINATRRAFLGEPDSPMIRRLLRALVYYNCLLTVCFHELDLLIERDDLLCNIHGDQEIPIFNLPPRNRTIDELSEEDAYALTRFRKHQLRLLMLHLRIPNTVAIGPRYRFSGEELLIVCLTRFATGDPWTRLIPSHFGGEVRRWSFAFRWFVDHLFITFFHKISGRSIEGWIGHMDVFKRSILGRLAKPAHPFEVEFDNQLAHPQYIIECPIDSWRVFGFIDDTNVWTCRPGSGPVGNRNGPGRPRRQFADLIQRAFYR